MRTVKANMPLKLEGSKNTRELGGYPVADGGNTASGQFLRSDNPSKFTETDKKRLYGYGVRLVVDFRSVSESQQAPCALENYEDIEYINPQMLDYIHSGDDSGTELRNALPSTLGDMYIDFLNNKQHVYLDVFKNILRHLDNCIFFNCSAGKDRAGTFAMIMLKLAGVPDDVVITDYQASGDNIREDMDAMLKNLRAQSIDFDEDMLRSRPVHMERALEHLNKTYGTIEKWMDTIGLAGDEIAKLKNKILGRY